MEKEDHMVVHEAQPEVIGMPHNNIFVEDMKKGRRTMLTHE